MKVQIEISNFDAHPYEVWKALEDKRAEKEWALKNEKVEIPKYVKEKVAYPIWVRNLVKGTLGQLIP